jgi:hypothetical protein
MTAATREQQATAEARLEEMFEKGSMAQKLVMKALAGFTVMMDSKLDRSVRFDGFKATVDMVIKGAELHALNTLRKCANETQAPLEFVHGIMGLRAIDDLDESERRFNTMMLLFVDEAEKRAGGGEA